MNIFNNSVRNVRNVRNPKYLYNSINFKEKREYCNLTKYLTKVLTTCKKTGFSQISLTSRPHAIFSVGNYLLISKPNQIL